MVALPPCPRECGDPSPPNSTHAHLSRGRRTRHHPSCPRECGDPSPPNSTHAHLSRGRRTRHHPSCPRECGDPSPPISPVADVHGATPLVLADAGTHPHPTQPTPISPVADAHGTTPLVLADAGTHPRINGGRSQTTLPYNRHSDESRNPSPDPKTERLHKTSPSVITNTPSATTMKIAPHTSPRRGNPL